MTSKKKPRTIRTQPVDPFSGRPLAEARTRARVAPLPTTPPRVSAGPGEDVPEGKVQTILRWVDAGSSSEIRSARARAATTAEHGRGTPRKSLLTQLAERTGRR